MKPSKILAMFMPLWLTCVFVTSLAAQDGRPPEGQPKDAQRPQANQPQDVRNNVLAQLGLSRQQIQLMRRLNADRKPLMDAAQQRFRLANRSLDDAIYADQVNETEVQARLKEVQLAQAEVVRIRYLNEFAVRRILTPEQLFRFRDLRQRFEQTRQAMDRRQSGQPVNRPIQNNVNRPMVNNNVQPVRPNQRKPDF